MAGLPLVSQPGEIFNYGKSTDLLGILISTIEGKSLGKVMEEKIFNPLAMTDTFFDVPDNKRNRCASNIGYDESGNLVNLETVPSKMAFKERPGDLEFESGSRGTLVNYGRLFKICKNFCRKREFRWYSNFKTGNYRFNVFQSIDAFSRDKIQN